MIMAKLTEMDVLKAMPRSAAMWTGYIVDQLRRDHNISVRDGKLTGHPPRSGLVLTRLRALEAKNLIKCTGGPNGYYGFTWDMLPAGRAALAVVPEQRGSGGQRS
jgi:hypothetical protein